MKDAYSKQQGTALITALFVMTLVAIVVTALSWRLQVDIRRTQLQLTATQLYYRAEGVNFWGMGLLKHSQKLTTPLPQFSQRLKNGTQVNGQLVDATGRFNINNLVFDTDVTQTQNKPATSPSIKMLAQLLHNQVKQMSAQAALTLSQQTWRWLKRSGHVQGVSDVSELRLIPGWRPAIYQTVAPYLSALPEKTRINLNTASMPVLRLLGLGLSPAQAQQIIELRQQNKGIFKWGKKLGNLGFDLNKQQTSFKSAYFYVTAKVHHGQQDFLMQSLLHLKPKSKVDILWKKA
jgi:general secretion pathway protein K